MQSAVEVVKLVLETLDALFNMQLPVAEQPLRSLMTGIDGSLCRWGQAEGGAVLCHVLCAQCSILSTNLNLQSLHAARGYEYLLCPSPILPLYQH